MGIRCPGCRLKIAQDDINPSTDVALCRGCGKNHSVELLSSGATADLHVQPSGTRFEITTEGFVVESTVRTWEAFVAVPFLCLWTFMFLRAMLQLHQKFEFGLPFPWPALAVWLSVTSYCSFLCFGKVRVTRCADELEIFSGLGPIGWYRKCRWSEI